jgi:lysozyme family protein
MRRFRKKVEYYLSWSQANTDTVSDLAADIETWISDWKPQSSSLVGNSDCDDAVVDRLELLQLPSAKETLSSAKRMSGVRFSNESAVHRNTASTYEGTLMEVLESRKFT